ncbi:MAG: OmpH family outer membrane protein [Amaricoccus sp.]|uniref:OmpH family outer membrane protein n=1 Tax=Amaricoccus sp. TaxID=1872485 RepID=UPI0039E5F8C7
MPRPIGRPAAPALVVALMLFGTAAVAQDDDDGPLARPAPTVPPTAVPAVRPDFGLSPAQVTTPEPGTPLPFLFINQERLLTDSRSGQAILAEEDRQRDALRSEARALDKSFEDEERRLTDQRPTLPAEEFRKLSDAFDARVVQARRDQDSRAAQLAQEFDQRRRQFYAQVAPVLVSLMDRYGARAIFDEASVLLADQSLNITQAVIAEIDARAPEATAPAAPATVPSDPAAEEQGGN